MTFEESHWCEKCHGKIIAIEVDELGNTFCGYCHTKVNYSQQNAKKDVILPIGKTSGDTKLGGGRNENGRCLFSADNQCSADKPKVIILDNNPISLMSYAEEFPEDFESICKAMKKNQIKRTIEKHLINKQLARKNENTKNK